MKKSKKIGITILVCLAATGISLLSFMYSLKVWYKKPEVKVKMIDAATECLEKLVQSEDEDRDKYLNKANRYIDRIGGLSVLDEEFINEFVNQYDSIRLIKAVDLIENHIFENDHWWSEENCPCQYLTYILQQLVSRDDFNCIVFNERDINKKGWYADHTVEFNESDFSDSEHPTEVKVTYYNDFAVEETSSYYWYEGRYEWVNGVFYDELPSWQHKNNTRVFYKGKCFYESVDQIKKFKFIEQNNDVFIIRPGEKHQCLSVYHYQIS